MKKKVILFFSLILFYAQPLIAETIILSEKDALFKEVSGDLLAASEHFERIGELLITNGAPSESLRLFEKALRLNPENQAALFYSALINPMLVMQGFVARLDGISDTQRRSAKDKLCSKIETIVPNTSFIYNLICHVPTGVSKFKGYHEIQRFLRLDILQIILDSAEKLQKLSPEKPLEINVDSGLLKHIVSQELLSKFTKKNNHFNCIKDADGYWTCNIFDGPVRFIMYPTKPIGQLYINKADIDVLVGSFLAFADFIRMFTAYNFTGLEHVISQLKVMHVIRKIQGQELSESRNLTAQDVIEPIMKYKKLFVLESDHLLNELNRSIESVLQHALSLNTLTYEVCQSTIWKMDDYSFLKRFFCDEDATVRNIEYLLDLIAGPEEIQIGVDYQYNLSLGKYASKPVTVLVDISSILREPTTDLKKLLPSKFDKDGDALMCPDKYFGGLFPKGDLFWKLKKARSRSIKKVN